MKKGLVRLLAYLLGNCLEDAFMQKMSHESLHNYTITVGPCRPPVPRGVHQAGSGGQAGAHALTIKTVYAMELAKGALPILCIHRPLPFAAILLTIPPHHHNAR
jgi:hypothetical protein